MLMGTADKLPDPPPEPTKFVEDMPDVQDAADLAQPAGLRNLGNTCYLNSGLQVMRHIPELATALRSYRPPATSEPGANLVAATRDLLGELDRSTAAREVLPLRFVSTFRSMFPRFAEQTEQGGYAQQDAEVRAYAQGRQNPSVTPSAHARARSTRVTHGPRRLAPAGGASPGPRRR